MIDSYGWSPALQHEFLSFAAHGFSPGRVIVQQRGAWRLVTPHGEVTAELSGRFVRDAGAGGHPVAGDWVVADVRPEEGAAIIRQLLPRRTAFVRRAAGGETAQVAAANVDVAFLVASLNADLNLRRLERYLALAYESGAEPVVVLTKSDLCADVAAAVAEVEAVALAAPVLTVSAYSGEGLDAVAARLTPGHTAVLLGSSGAGKSTLVNALAGRELMATQDIREDDARGRHTTTHRELVLLPSGGLVLDTPGMRELGLWDADGGLATAFADVERYAEACRFTDCRHRTEPGCAVRAALESGELPAERVASFDKLQRELAHLRRKEDPRLRQAEKKRWATIHRSQRAHYRFKDAHE
jgi:ribosome biogenesis GTPase